MYTENGWATKSFKIYRILALCDAYTVVLILILMYPERKEENDMSCPRRETLLLYEHQACFKTDKCIDVLSYHERVFD